MHSMDSMSVRRLHTQLNKNLIAILLLQLYVSGSGDHCPSLPQVDATLSPVRVQVKFSVEPSTDTLGTLLMVTPLAGMGEEGQVAR